MIRYYLWYLWIINPFTFILYGTDKRRARRGEWRIPEKVLLNCSLLGGAPGGLLAMKIFRHKTRHASFYLINILAIFIHLLLFFFLKKA